jgi:hypothetical protein
MSGTASSSLATSSSGKRPLRLPESKIRSQVRQGMLYAYPKEKSLHRFMDEVRQRTKRTTPLQTKELIAALNPLLRGWGEYYKTRPRSQALPSPRRLDPETDLVASL